MLKDVNAIKFEKGKKFEIKEVVAEEVFVRLKSKEYEFSTFMSPSDYEPFSLGHIMSAGIISTLDNFKIKEIEEKDEEIIVNIDINKVFKEVQISKLELDEKTVFSINSYVRANAPLFEKSGAFHYSYLFDKKGNIISQAFDIGRFNAIDKVIGKCILSNIGLNDKILFTTGRISLRTVEKACNTGIPIIISKAPPMYGAIVKAKEFNITIIGFSRDSRFTTYT